MTTSKLSWAFVLTIVFIHYMFARPYGFPLTIAPFSVLLLIYGHVEYRITPRFVYSGIALISLPLLNLTFHQTYHETIFIVDFFKTYALWVFSSMSVLAIATLPLKNNALSPKSFFTALTIVTAFSALQFFESKYLGTSILFNPFGDSTYMGKYNESIFTTTEIPRTPGLYLEPSFNAFVTFFLIVGLLLTPCRRDVRLVFISLGAGSFFIYGSMSGILNSAFLFVFLGVTAFFKSRFSRIVATLGAVLVVFFLASKSSGFNRILEVFVDGTSGYWRLVAPLEIIKETIFNHPLGVPLGQVEKLLLPLGLNHGSSIGTSIDNGAYLLIFYFGLFGLAALLFILTAFIKAVLNGNISDVTFLWFLFGSMQFTGGILLPEFVFPLLVIILQYRSYNKQYQIKGNKQRNRVFHSTVQSSRGGF